METVIMQVFMAHFTVQAMYCQMLVFNWRCCHCSTKIQVLDSEIHESSLWNVGDVTHSEWPNIEEIPDLWLIL